jgi:hypothetical protein
LKDYTRIYSSAAEKIAQEWERVADTGKKVDVSPQITALTLDIIGVCAFNTHLKAQDTLYSPQVSSHLMSSFSSFSALTSFTHLLLLFLLLLLTRHLLHLFFGSPSLPSLLLVLTSLFIIGSSQHS